MTGAKARLDKLQAGVSLWLTDWKADLPWAWTGRRILALVGGEQAGCLDFVVHPDGQALSVWMLGVEPGYRGRNLASVMMDALYAAYPTAWIDHGGRTPDGGRWWDRYSDPAPERNIHNRPTSEWASYFDAVQVASRKAGNARLNTHLGVDGHRGAEYRYGERLEEEAQRYAPAFREASAQGPDPSSQELYGGMRLVLPPRLHQWVHEEARDVDVRADMLLHHIGHGNLPFLSAWDTTGHAAFEQLAHEQLGDPVSPESVTHLTFRVLPLAAGGEVPQHILKATWVRYVDSPGIEVQLAGMSWRLPNTPWITHQAAFTPPVDAAIGPEFRRNASAEYNARYDEIGELRPGQTAQRAMPPHPFAGREEEIRAWAARLREASAQRTDKPGPGPAADVVREDHGAQQHSSPSQSPRLR